MDELIQTAEKAALSVEGVASLTGKRLTLTKDKNQDLIFDVYLLARYGCRIPEMAWDIQETVKNEVAGLTEASISKINIHVQGVSFDEQ
jgi:uncharacterized alkaline shock family protein YloU